MMDGGTYYLGVDGGGTGCRARLADREGRILGEGQGGSANIFTDLAGAAEAISRVCSEALRAAGLRQDARGGIHAGLGVAGAGVPMQVERLARHDFGFAAVRIATDTEVACLGAHRGGEGAILVLGTGSQGVLRRGGGFSAIGGWGFMVSDAGSGAALGHAAVRRSLGAQDGIGDASDFTREVMARWEHDPVRLLAWSAAAGPRDWATLAPVVFDWEARGDVVAREVLRAAIGDVEAMIDRLGQLGAARIALMGGLADRYRPHLAERLAGLLVAPMGDALEGALHLAGLGQDGHQPGAPKLR